MTLRDCLVRGGIVDSARVCALKPATQLFFRNLLHVCDGAARFEADADRLRTVLYGRVLSKVSRGDVTRWLIECQQADLIKLYTRDGRGYGKVDNYGQRDTKRKVLYPDEERDGLFATGSPEEGSGAPRPQKGDAGFFSAPDPEVNRREGKKAAPARVEAETQAAWLARLQEAHPHLKVSAELKAAKRYCDRQLKKLDRVFFERWLEGTGAEVVLDETPGASPQHIEPEPEGWRVLLKDRYEGEDWAETAACLPWPSLPANWRSKITREMQGAA